MAIKHIVLSGGGSMCFTIQGILSKTNIIFKPGYQVHLAREIKKRTGIITRTTGMISDLNHAQKIISNGSADIVNFARKFIKDPTWLINAIKKRNKKVSIPNQYKRCF